MKTSGIVVAATLAFACVLSCAGRQKDGQLFSGENPNHELGVADIDTHEEKTSEGDDLIETIGEENKQAEFTLNIQLPSTQTSVGKDFVATVKNISAHNVVLDWFSIQKKNGAAWRTTRVDVECPCMAKCNKPIIVLKGGMTEGGNKAATSHTGVLAGSAEVYEAAFKQAGILVAETTEELFNYARVLEKCKLPKGKKVQIITDGGGFGVLATDAVIKNGLELAEMEWENRQLVKRVVPHYAIVKNPIDLTGDADAERYHAALTASIRDPNVDMILTILLYQVPTLDPEIVEIMTNLEMQTDKPIVTVSAGGLFTEVHMDFLEDHGVPSFDSPTDGVKALAALARYADIKKR